MLVNATTRLSKADDFSSVFNFKARFYTQHLNFFYMPNQLGFSRIGFIVSKKISKRAVDRNYIKRVLRSLLRQYALQKHFDIIIQCKQIFKKEEFLKIQDEIHAFIEKIN
ncbi:MAG: ribonuclease P protein component [Nitrosomonadales bacterium]